MTILSIFNSQGGWPRQQLDPELVECIFYNACRVKARKSAVKRVPLVRFSWLRVSDSTYLDDVGGRQIVTPVFRPNRFSLLGAAAEFCEAEYFR
jgi:hypothetical protein